MFRARQPRFGSGLLVMCCSLLLAAMQDAGAAPGELLVDGDFETVGNGASLRRDDKGQDWYESRRDGAEGHALLKLSTRDVGGNATHKAMIKADPEHNTYLSQRFAPQTGRFMVQYDLYVREILPDDNRSAFFLVGGIKDRKNGPNSTGAERFVFLGCENGSSGGLMNLFAREGSSAWGERTPVALNLELGRWYTIVADIDVAAGVYRVKVNGVTDWFDLESFYTKGKALKKLTHLSFASWDDGAGTFYVDNVRAWTP